jgi:tRNA(fMet)-specific endonuclease VapC
VKYVLDTNTVSALMNDSPPAIAKLKTLDRGDVAVPQPVFAEIAYGIARLPKSRRRDALHERFELVRSVLPVMVWSDEVTDAFGEIKAQLERSGKRVEDFDVAIAAHAIAHDVALATTNVKHMSRIDGLVVESWL